MGTYVRSGDGQRRGARPYATRVKWGAVRLAFVALAVGLILGLLVPRLLASGGGSAEPKKHVGVWGGNMWVLAGRYGDGGDRRRFVYEAIRLNGLRSPAVYPGQQLVLPFP